MFLSTARTGEARGEARQALHLAASFADQDCTEILVLGGACVSVRDKLGLVPADETENFLNRCF